ncbi:MAG TPA: 2-phospho-L-lactate guanylyltransferase, partial [Candidatus Deferrimicrobium sp.]|nr:2-phospho-L-lactate guanylyltransferase [Candidatus Deferrimicrobium sp.]
MPNPSHDPGAGGASPRLVAIIPVGSLDEAKSRLGAVLDAEERLELTLRLARGTIAAAVAADRVDEVVVITPDDTVRALAVELGARPIRQRDSGLNHGLVAARGEALAAGAEAILILPIDLPAVTARAIDEVAAAIDRPDRPLVAIVPDRHGRGTNALLIAPPDAIDVCFGGDSAVAHQAAARAAGARLEVLGGALTLDLDTPDDLLLAE